MPEFIPVGSANELREGQVKAFQVKGEAVAVARVGDAYYAFGDTCSHAMCSLSEGDLDGMKIICACHGSEFDVTSGQVLNPPAAESVPSYRTRVEGGQLQIEM